MSRYGSICLMLVNAVQLSAQDVETDSLASMDALLEASKYTHIESYAEAEPYLEMSTEADPRNSAAYFLWARLCRATKRPQEALNHIDRAIELQPANISYYLEAASIARSEQYLMAAARYYEQLLERRPDTYVYYEDLAHLYLEMGEYGSAIEAATQLIEHDYTPSAGRLLRDAYMSKGDTTAAEEVEARLAHRFVENDTLQISYAEALLRRSGPGAAIEYLASICNGARPRGWLSLRLALYYLRNEAYEEASERFLEAYRDPTIGWKDKVEALGARPLPRPFWPFVPSLLEQLLSLDLSARLKAEVAHLYERTGYLTQATNLYRMLLKEGVIELKLFERVIGLELRAGAYDSALSHIQLAERYYPLQPRLYLLRARAYMATEEVEKARHHLERGLSTCYDPKLKATLYLGIGDTHQKAPPSALKAYEEAMALQPNDPEALSRYSYMLARTSSRLGYAERLAKQLIEQYPDRLVYLYVYASVLYAQKRYEEALPYVEQALSKEIETNPYLSVWSRGRMTEHYGDLLYQLGRPEEALSAWQRAQALGGTSPLLERKIQDKKLYE